MRQAEGDLEEARYAEAGGYYDVPLKVDPVFMNTEVFLKKLRNGVPFILQIIKEGKVIEKDEEF